MSNRRLMIEFLKIRAARGLPYLISGFEPSRCIEYPTILAEGEFKKGEKVLDIGTGHASPLPIYLIKLGLEVHATDVDPSVFRQRENAKRAGLSLEELKRLIIRQEDAKSLSYRDGVFDKIVACSSIEHIKGEGDSQAAKEMARVVKKGGLVLLAVPFNPNKGYVRKFGDGVARWYDSETLKKRVIQSSGLKLKKLIYFDFRSGWRNFYGRLWWKFPRYIRYLLGWANPFLQLYEETEDVSRGKDALLILEKER